MYNCKLVKRVGSSKEITYNQFFLIMEVISWLKGLATLWNQKYKCFRTYISYQKISHVEFFCQSASLKLLQMFCSEYIVVMLVESSKKTTTTTTTIWENLLSSSSGWLILKNVKQTRRDVFHLWIKCLYEKYCLY